MENPADKIGKLLRKAESTDSTAEAEMLLEKAQDLMERYAITQIMIDAASGTQRYEIVRKTIRYKSAYHHGLRTLGCRIAEAQGCRVFITSYGKNDVVVNVVGYEDDVDRAIMLDASLQIQMAGALRRAVRSGEVPQFGTAMQKFKEKRQFMFGFSHGVGERLERVKKATRTDEVSDTSGMELVLRGRKDHVDDYVESNFSLRRLPNPKGGSMSSSSAGRAAGRNADTGSSGGLRNKKALAG